jgi:hypothetical protein
MVSGSWELSDSGSWTVNVAAFILYHFRLSWEVYWPLPLPTVESFSIEGIMFFPHGWVITLYWLIVNLLHLTNSWNGG